MIVGRNGSGKTSLVKLITQLYNKYNGIQNKIALVFQDFMQYEMSMRDNIGLGNVNNLYNDTKILKAAHSSEIAYLVNKLPNKGSHQELLKENGIYKKLYEIQASNVR